MRSEIISPAESISLFVKDILVLEDDARGKKNLPFFADGYPGIMFQQTANGLFVSPQNKKMPLFFLYGQTIHPIELIIDGSYSLICFQLYPFVLNSFFNLDAKDLNDDCYDLSQLSEFNAARTIEDLDATVNIENIVIIITAFLYKIFEAKREMLDYKIRQAIELIINNNGSTSITELIKTLNINERTFERRFTIQVGISPKQFSKIIKFQSSLNQLTHKDYNNLTDVVYNNGYADQSHFIRVFKAFTGKTPKKFSAGNK